MTPRKRGAVRPGFAGMTDVGLVRPGNEDAYAARPPLFAVADGLGGHQAGEVASNIAIETLEDLAPRDADVAALDAAVCAANAAVIAAARDGKGRIGMGTTLTAVVVDGLRLAVAHVGDSRAYLLHDDSLSRITQDHSMVADMIRQGTLTEEESRYHPNRSVITRALGTDPGVTPDAFELRAAVGDRLLLSTDGLHGQVSDVEIADILRSSGTPAEAARALVDAANTAGGGDNVTVVIVDIDGSGGATPDPGPTREPGAVDKRWRRWLARGLWVLAALAVVAAGWFGLRAYADSRAYLKAENGLVVIYQGVAGTFVGVRLDRIAQTTDVNAELLRQERPAIAARLAEPGGIPMGSLQEARDWVAQYRAEQRLSTVPGELPGSPAGTAGATAPSLPAAP